jgi:hypothetical protein
MLKQPGACLGSVCSTLTQTERTRRCAQHRSSTVAVTCNGVPISRRCRADFCSTTLRHLEALRERAEGIPALPLCRAISIEALAAVRQLRESSDNPRLNAFCRVAPSLRLRLLAIFLAGVLLRAADFNSRTSAFVQARLFEFLLAIYGSPNLDVHWLSCWRLLLMRHSASYPATRYRQRALE